MCGILGLVTAENSRLSVASLNGLLNRLFLLSESRGKEAAGIAVATRKTIRVLRKPVPASTMLRSADYRSTIDEALAEAGNGTNVGGIAALGHARLVTNGLQGIDANNQPVVKHNVVCVHNGIIVNEAELWRANPALERTSGVDTEVLAAILDREVRQSGSIESATRTVFASIYGEASIAAFFASGEQALLATNTGSLFAASNSEQGVTFFASELVIAKRVIKQLNAALAAGFDSIRQIKAGEGCILDLRSGAISTTFALAVAPTGTAVAPVVSMRSMTPRRITTSSEAVLDRWRRLRRCARCVLPKTMPFIDFDNEGICNYCRNHRGHRLNGRDALERILEKYRSGNGEPDCLVGFSGGRDSSYALHLLKTELGMTPIAYTYDWGMVTDLARRNQARLCGKLGVEHIWVSADIRKKRLNVKQNVEAWMRKPDLGVVPLFMAGDKQFMYHANRLMQESGIRLMVYATNHYERTDFKVGFCGIRPADASIRLHKLSALGKAGLALYYLRSFLTNPGYINSSLLDTFTAFLSYYFINQDFLYLFDYLDWNEEKINHVLRKEYDWELAHDTSTTWRIGDGTAPFYNYIYQAVAGFSEYETFRSNQVREGVISRDEAMRLINEENVPRFESIQEYCRLISVDFDQAMRAIDGVPKRY
jgi:glutamine---fructose-6-phosphate transaminase (isomerizing)